MPCNWNIFGSLSEKNDIKNNNIGEEEVEITVYEQDGQTIKTVIKTPTESLTLDTLNKELYQISFVQKLDNKTVENNIKIERKVTDNSQNIGIQYTNNTDGTEEKKFEIQVVQNKEEDWKEQVKEAEDTFSEDITETLMVLGKTKTETSQNYQDAMKLLHARVNNLESNLHIEIDMERIEDRSKALSYIGIEVADALKSIPTPVDITEQETVVEQTENVEQVEPIEEIEEQQVEKIKTAKTKKSKKAENVQKVEENTQEQTENVEQQTEQVQVIEEQQVEKTKKPSLWQRFKNSKFVRTIKYVMKIRVVLDYPALPEGRGENN